MRSLLVSACLLALAGVAVADSYTNDCTTLANVFSIYPSPYRWGSTYLDPNGPGILTDVPDTGYSFLLDIPAGSDPANTLNLTGNKLMDSVKYVGPATGSTAFWARIWNGVFTGRDDPNGNPRAYKGWELTMRPAYAGIGWFGGSSGWQTFTHDIAVPQDIQAYGGLPISVDVTKVWGISQGAVVWDASGTPYTFGLRSIQSKPDLDRQIRGVSLGDYDGPVWTPDANPDRAAAGIASPKFAVEIRVVPAGGNPNAPYETVYPLIQAQGKCYAGTVTPPGTYDLYIAAVKPDGTAQIQYHWLSKIVRGVQFDASGATINAALLNGDIDLDGMITVFDYSALSDAFDKTSADSDWDIPDGWGVKPRDSDLDGDEAVTVFDYIILSNNFDMVGDF